MNPVPLINHPCTICCRATSMWCSRCQTAWYCSLQHLSEDWPRHRNQCIPTSEWDSLRLDPQQTPLFYSPVRGACPERYRLSKTVLDATYVQEVQIGVNQGALYAGHGPTYARNVPHASRRGWTAESIGLLSQDIHRDAGLLLSNFPSVLGECELYNKYWAELEVHCIRNRIEGSEIICQWGACDDRLKIKEIKTHLVLKHDVDSNSKPYACSWNGCSSRMTEFSSLVRHIRECHCSEYKWPCPSCGQGFTREETLWKHFKKCSARKKSQAAPQDLMVSGQKLA